MTLRGIKSDRMAGAGWSVATGDPDRSGFTGNAVNSGPVFQIASVLADSVKASIVDVGPSTNPEESFTVIIGTLMGPRRRRAAS